MASLQGGIASAPTSLGGPQVVTRVPQVVKILPLGPNMAWGPHGGRGSESHTTAPWLLRTAVEGGKSNMSVMPQLVSN